MSLTVLKILLVLGIVGHALNMYCDRILSVFPNGKLTLMNMKDIGAAHHVKTALVEYVFLKLGRDEQAKLLMLDMLHSAPVTRICYVGYLVFIITLIVAIATGVAGVPLWAVIFTVLPIFIIMFPFRIIGTLHISAMVSLLAWLFLI